jgi:dTDP-4-dehydrorhamnose 3,5-epimerase-like enzyme
MVICDERDSSSSAGESEEIVLGSEGYSLIIPPGVWDGFEGTTGVAAVAPSALTPTIRKGLNV